MMNSWSDRSGGCRSLSHASDSRTYHFGVDEQRTLERVAELRAGGGGPKQIAKALGISKSAASNLIRRQAESERTELAPYQREVVGCLINPGWSQGLGLDAAPELAAADPVRGDGQARGGGFAQILVARRDRASKITVCGFLVDVYCLGVKDAVPPKAMGIDSLGDFAQRYFSAFEDPPVPISLPHAQAIVAGAIAYARDLGFEPHRDFAAAEPFLGAPPADVPAIGFGHEGMPLYINGPRDNAMGVVATLRQRCGEGNFHYLLADGPP